MKTLYIIGSGASHAENRRLPIGRQTLGLMLNLKQSTLDKHRGSFGPDISSLNRFVFSCNREDEQDFERVFDWINAPRNERRWILRYVWRNRVICDAIIYLDSHLQALINSIEKKRGLKPCPDGAIIPSGLSEAGAIVVGLRYLLLPSKSCKIPTHQKFIRDVFKEGDVIATTNYDILLDRAIWARYKKINYGSDSIKQAESAGFSMPHNAPLLLKLHGSFSWSSPSAWWNSYLPAISKIIKKSDKIYIKGQTKEHPRTTISERIEAYDGFVKISERDRTSLIMPGTSKEQNIKKNQVINEVWDRLDSELKKCDRIVIIGSSVMRSGSNDSHLRKRLAPYKSKIVTDTNDFRLYVKYPV